MKLQPKSATQTKKKKSGFTLIEVIAVLVLLGILAAIALPKYIDMAENAKDRAIDAGISELNGREALAWGKAMLQDGGYVATSDAAIQTAVGTDIGPEYTFVASSTTAGTIQFQDTPTPALALIRTISTGTNPATWTR